MELRDIEIFLAVAEHLHFRRAAEALHVSPARVTQAVKKQERRLGAPLFERNPRAVRLTPAGEQLYRVLSAGYRQIMGGIREVKASAVGVSGALTIGAMGPQPWMICDMMAKFRVRHPMVQVRFREIQPTAPLAELRRGEVDVALVWLPVHEPDITVGPVTHTSSVVLMVGATHPLAGRESVELEDLGDCTVLTGTDLPASMEAAFHPSFTPSGRAVARGPARTGWLDAMTTVVAGTIVCAAAAEAARFYPWPELVYLPIRDAPPTQWALAWRTGGETPTIRALVRSATE